MENNYIAEPRGPWRAFAYAGFSTGIVSLVLFWIPWVGIFVGIPGIVLSALGRRSVIQHGKANTGLGLSIAAVVLSVIWLVIFYTLIISLALASASQGNTYR